MIFQWSWTKTWPFFHEENDDLLWNCYENWWRSIVIVMIKIETMNHEENDDLMIYGDFNGEIGLELDKLFQTNSQWFQDWGSHVSPWPAIANHIDSSNRGSVLFTNQLGSTVLPVSTNCRCLKGPKVSLFVNPGAPRWMQSSKSNLRLTLTNSGQLAEPRRWSDAVWLMICASI